MAVINGIQYAFNAGELTPRLDGRTDSEVYFQGVKEMTNFLTTPYGTAERPQGTRYLNSTKNDGEARFIPFQFSTEQTYSLEFGEGYIRFYKEEGQIESAPSTPYEIVSPYATADLDDLYITQSADVLFIYHPDYNIRELTRTGHTSWTITEHVTTWGPFLDPNTSAVTLNPSGTTGSITITASTATFNTGHIGSYWQIGHGYVEITGVATSTSVTATVIETVVAGAVTDWAEGAWSIYRGFPRCGTFHEQRLVSAGTNYEPRKFWGSKQFVYNDHEVDATKDAYAYSFECASSQVNAIEWLSSGNRLSLGTSDGVWTAYAVNEAITATNILVGRQHSKGSVGIIPQVIGSSTYYVSADNRKIWEHGFDFNINGYDAKDMTLFAEHITLSGIKEMALQTLPNNYLWCVLENGKLISMLRDKAEAVTGWTNHTTDGEYESIAVIREDNKDQVWVVVNRTIGGATKRYVEFFEDLYTPEAPTVEVRNSKEDLFYVHSGLTYDSAIDITGITQADPAVVTSNGHGLNDGDHIRIVDVSGMTEVNSTDYIVAGAATNTFELQDTDSADVDSTGYTTYTSGGEIYVYTDTITGLSHLEGKSVAILGDGNVLAEATVSSGSITLSKEVAIAQVGLPYTSEIETMRIDGGSFQGSAQGKTKRIVDAVIRLYRTIGFKYGNDAAEYEYNENQQVWDDSEDLFTGDVPVKMPDLWDRAGRAKFKQEKPLSFNVVALMLNVTTS